MTDNEKKAVELIKSQNEQIKQLKTALETKGEEGVEKKSEKEEKEEKIDFGKEIENLKNQLHVLASKPKDNKNEFDDILEAMKKA